jgi:hypothetical protein
MIMKTITKWMESIMGKEKKCTNTLPDGKTYLGNILSQVVEDSGPISQIRGGERKGEHVGGGGSGASVECIGNSGGGGSDVVEEGYVTGRLSRNYKHLVCNTQNNNTYKKLNKKPSNIQKEGKYRKRTSAFSAALAVGSFSFFGEVLNIN